MNDTTPRRRFKKRYVAFALLLIAILLAGAIVWQALTAKPGPLVNYQERMYELSAAVQSQAPDRWKVLAVALAEMEGAREALQAADESAGLATAALDPCDTLYSAGYGQPDEFAEMQVRARKWLEGFTEAGLFEQTAQFPAIQAAMRPVTDEPLATMMMQHCGGLRSLARIQAARMHLAAERGDWAEYTVAFEEMLAAARLVASQTTYIEYLVGLAIEALSLIEVRRDIVDGMINEPAVLDELLAAMKRQPMPDVIHALEGERLMLLDIIQRVHTDDGHGDGRLILTELSSRMIATPLPHSISDLRIANAAAAFFPSRAETVADLDQLFAPGIAAAKIPPHERGEMLNEMKWVDSLSPRQVVVRQLAPWPGDALRTADQSTLLRAGSKLLLRVERYRLGEGRGKAPASLADLAAADPEADLIDPMTGELFLYKRLGDDPHGRPYLLYAPGGDGQDDGGVAPEAGPPEAYRRGVSGVDYVLNPPPPQPKWDQ